MFLQALDGEVGTVLLRLQFVTALFGHRNQDTIFVCSLSLPTAASLIGPKRFPPLSAPSCAHHLCLHRESFLSRVPAMDVRTFLALCSSFQMFLREGNSVSARIRLSVVSLQRKV